MFTTHTRTKINQVAEFNIFQKLTQNLVEGVEISNVWGGDPLNFFFFKDCFFENFILKNA
jgi:hypothetical protein